MAIYRCEFKIYSRGKAHSAAAASAYVTGSKVTAKRGGNSGKRGGMGSNRKAKYVSAVEAAAYRSGGTLTDRSQDKTYDYTAKGGVVWSGILTPEGAPAWASDRGRLWNEVEKREDRSTSPKTAQLFREALLTIPRGLTRDQQIALVRSYVQDQFVSRGMVADIGIHAPDASDGLEQPHAHVMLTLRDFKPDGTFGNKRPDWNGVNWLKNIAFKEDAGKDRKDGFLRQSRAQWADYCNAALEEAGSTETVSHLSLKARGIDRKPQQKIGKAKYARPAAWAAGAEAMARDMWAHNRAIQVGRVAADAYRRDGRRGAGLVALSAFLEGGEVLADHTGLPHEWLASADSAVQQAGSFTLRLTGHGSEAPGDYDPWGHDER